ADDGLVRTGQLQTHEQGFNAADQEEHDRGPEVKDADALVIDSGHPAPKTALSLGLGQRLPKRAFHRYRRHDQNPSAPVFPRAAVRGAPRPRTSADSIA